MKKLQLICMSLLAVSALVISGCDDFLEQEPQSDLSTDTYFKSKGDMRTWVHGTYDEVQTALIGANAAALEWGDLRSDNYGNTGYGDTRVYMNAIDASQGQWTWEYLYRVIDRCNVGIKMIPEIPSILPGEYNDYVGQLHGLRALMYFYAVRVWGDVPLTTEPWDGIDASKANLPRSSADDVKAQILSDIDKAIEMLSSDVARKFYFNRAAAWALKTDVHMWFKEYDQAKTASDYFIGHATIKLLPTAASGPGGTAWKNMFTDPANAVEGIFTIAWSQDPTLPDGTNQWAQRVGASNTNNTYQVSRGIFNEFITRHHSGTGRDGRFWGVLDTLKLSLAGGTKTSPSFVYVPLSPNHYGLNGTTKNTKFSVLSTVNNERWVVISTTTCTVQLPIYRLADVMLLRAEALNQLGDGAGALAIVNSIRNRIGFTANALTEVDPADKIAVENLILKERQLEFMGEGKRWFDLMRTNKVIEVMDPVMKQRQDDYNVEIIGFGDEGRIRFPIYYKEFEANPALRGAQNPPYTEG
jgi:starch-binding outer membrane protein, SusD/RagB family